MTVSADSADLKAKLNNVQQSVKEAIDAGATLDQVMSRVALVIGDQMGTRNMSTDTMLSLFGVWPRINEQLELIMARGLIIVYDISRAKIPAALVDIEESTVRILRRIERAVTSGHDKPEPRRLAIMYEALLTQVSGVYKPTPDNGVDLFTAVFDQDTKILRMTAFQLKDSDYMRPCLVRSARDKLLNWILQFRTTAAKWFDPQIAANLLQVEWRIRLVVVGKVGRLTKKDFDDAREKNVDFVVAKGEMAMEYLFPVAAQREAFMQRIRRV